MTTLAPSFLIGSSSYLQVTRTSITSQTSSKFGQNGHIGSQSTGFEEVHGGQAIGKRNTEGERVLEFAFANELVVGNT